MTTNPTDALLRDILGQPRTIAMVGLSPNPARPSYRVAAYLTAQGHRVIGINPGQAGKQMFGQTVRAALRDLSPADGVDMIDVFRALDVVPQVVDAALALSPLPKIIWLQLDLVHPQAAAKAEAAGLTVIQDRCPKIEHERLFA